MYNGKCSIAKHFDLTLVIEVEYYSHEAYIRGSYRHIYYHQTQQNFNRIINKCYTFRSLKTVCSFCIMYSFCYVDVFLLLRMFRSRYYVSFVVLCTVCV
jgi:hypothetical protein